MDSIPECASYVASVRTCIIIIDVICLQAPHLDWDAQGDEKVLRGLKPERFSSQWGITQSDETINPSSYGDQASRQEMKWLDCRLPLHLELLIALLKPPHATASLGSKRFDQRRRHRRSRPCAPSLGIFRLQWSARRKEGLFSYDSRRGC